MGSDLFAVDYDAEFINFPEGRKEYLIGEETSFSTRRSILVDDHRGSEWVATFISPDMGRPSMTRIIPISATRKLAVVVLGALYFGCVDEPDQFEFIATDGPVSTHRSFPEEGIVVLATPWTVLCLDEFGVKWKTHRLAIEGIELEEMSDKLLHVEVDGSHEITLSLASGELVESTGPFPESFFSS